MFLVRIIRSIFNLVILIATLVTMGSLAAMTYDMATRAGQESKRGFLSISALNDQLLGN